MQNYNPNFKINSLISNFKFPASPSQGGQISNFRSGFTLLEIMATLAISAILFGYGFSKYSDFNKTQSLKAAGQNLKNNLRLIKTDAMAGIVPNGCDTVTSYQIVYVSTTQYKIDIICVTSGTTSTTYTLPTDLEFYGGSFGTINFKNAIADTYINVKNTKNNQCYKLEVEANGNIEDYGVGICGVSAIPSPSATPAASPTLSPTPTATPHASPSVTPTPIPTPTPTPSPSPTPTPTPVHISPPPEPSINPSPVGGCLPHDEPDCGFECAFCVDNQWMCDICGGGEQ